MLENKFRIRRKEDGKLLPDYFPACLTPDGRVIMESNAPIVYGGQHVGDVAFSDITGDSIIEWFTGLPDKDGREIYEGDIVQYEHIKAEIIYGFCGFEFKWVDCYTDKIRQRKTEPMFKNTSLIFKVIGNVHELEAK